MGRAQRGSAWDSLRSAHPTVWQTRIVLAAWGILLAVLCGCGQRHPDTLPAAGTVTYRGQPVDAARVMFMASEGSSGKAPAAHGTTNAQGRFELMTYVPGDGAMAGRYRVLITKREEVPDPEQPDSPYKLTRDLLPLRYASASESKLTAEVKAGEPNEFRFELED